jgi:hypothetical protein
MLIHPDMMMTLVNDRHRELIAEADKQHPLAGARAARRARRARKAAAVRGRPRDNLGSCEPSVVVPAR